MTTTKTSIKNLKPGKFCILDDEPCKVLDVAISAPGKHGGAKARMEAIGIFDNKKRSIVKPADSEIDVPLIEKKIGQVISLSGADAQIMDMTTYETFDAKIPEELQGKVQQGMEIQYWEIMGRRMIVGVK